MEASKQQAEVGRLLTRAEQSRAEQHKEKGRGRDESPAVRLVNSTAQLGTGVRNRVQYRATTAGPIQHSAQHEDFEFDPIEGELRTTTSPPPLLPAGGGREEEGEGRKGRVIWMDRSVRIWIKKETTSTTHRDSGRACGVGPTYPTLRHPAWHLSFGSRSPSRSRSRPGPGPAIPLLWLLATCIAHGWHRWLGPPTLPLAMAMHMMMMMGTTLGTYISTCFSNYCAKKRD